MPIAFLPILIGTLTRIGHSFALLSINLIYVISITVDALKDWHDVNKTNKST